MGFGDLGGGGKTQTSVAQTTYPDWFTGQQQNLINTGNGMLGNFLRNGQFGVAGTNPDQETAFDMARHSLINTYDTPGLSATGMGQAGGAQIGAGEAGQFMSPYIQGVVDPTVNSMRKDYATSAADIAARGAASSPFGGSRAAVERSNLDRNFADRSAQMVAQLMSQGWDRASAMAQANAQMRQQTSLSNASNGLAEVNANNTMLNSRLAREQSAVQQLLGIGNQQQQLQQTNLDYPLKALQMLLGITPPLSQTNNTVTKTEPDNSPGLGQQLLGGALTIAGMGTGGGSTLGGTLLSKLFK